MSKLFAILRSLFATLGAFGATVAPAQPIVLDSLLGIRIGLSIEAQLGQCPKNEKGGYEPGFQKSDKACWVPLTYGKEVRLPQKLMDETRIPFLTPKTKSTGVNFFSCRKLSSHSMSSTVNFPCQ